MTTATIKVLLLGGANTEDGVAGLPLDEDGSAHDAITAFVADRNGCNEIAYGRTSDGHDVMFFMADSGALNMLPNPVASKLERIFNPPGGGVIYGPVVVLGLVNDQDADVPDEVVKAWRELE